MSFITRNGVYRSYKISKSSINLPEVAKFGRIQVRLPWAQMFFTSASGAPKYKLRDGEKPIAVWNNATVKLSTLANTRIRLNFFIDKFLFFKSGSTNNLIYHFF